MKIKIVIGIGRGLDIDKDIDRDIDEDIDVYIDPGMCRTNKRIQIQVWI